MTYIPGSLTEPNKRHESYDELAAKVFENQEIEAPSSKGYPKYRDDFSEQPPPPSEDLKKEAEETYAKHREMVQTEYKCKKNGHRSQTDETPPHILNTIANFNLAKKLHSENLEHEPLPDALTDALYRKLQMQKYDKDPGLALKESPRVTGVGWKGYPGYGPTRCTKLKVYRPKTGVADKQTEKRDGRPNSVSSFDKKWRFIRQSKVTPIELAICWDLAPANPADEPKPSTHIDGSNGSLAPAVFSLVHTPKEDEVDDIFSKCSRKSSSSSNKSSKCSEKHGCDPLFDNLPKNNTTNEALPFLDRAKTAGSNHSTNSKNSKKSRARSACDSQQMQKQQNNNNNQDQINKNEIHKSIPNLHCKKWPHSRFCTACEMRNVKVKEKPKPEYKMAFKAGIPQPQRSVSTVVKTIFLKIPKQKDPYRKRNYCINSLAPPFSLQKDKKQCGYPDHWRLATVYQQSYKPIHTRKRPLIDSVFK